MFLACFNSAGDDFEDVEEDDNIDEMEAGAEEEGHIDLLQPGEASAGQLQTKRITTPYMTKFVDLQSFCLIGVSNT